MRALARPGRHGALRDLPFAAQVVAGDLADKAALSDLVRNADLVLHNAGLVRAPDRAAFFAANRDGARNVAAAAVTDGPPDAAFLLVSSLAATRPAVSDYAASKAAAETAVRETLAGRRLAILRPPAIYGPRDAATKPLFDAFRRGFAPRIGPAAARLAMMHVDDAARAALAAGRAAAASGPTFEVDDGGGGYTWAEIGAAAAAAAGRRLLPLPAPGALILAAGALGSMRARLGLGQPFMTLGKAREALAGDWLADPALAPPNWSPAISLRSGFTATLSWYRKRRREAR